MLSSAVCLNYSQSVKHRENGWYRIIDGQEDRIGNISKHKLQAWADSTEQLIGKRMGFIFNDTLITAPRVNMRIESGAFQISSPANYDMQSLYKSLLKEKKDSLDALFKTNGWENDMLFFNQLDQEKQDSIINTLDYVDAHSIIKGFENK